MRCLLPPYSGRAILGCLLVLALAAPSPGRKWRTINNLLTFDAELVAYDGKQARFSVDGGRDFSVPLEKLSEEDRQYLKTSYPDGLKDSRPKDSPKTPDDKPPADAPAPDAPAPDAPPAAEPAPPKVAAAARPVRSATKARARGGQPAKEGVATGMSVEVVSLTVTKPPQDELQGSLLRPGTHFTLLVSDPARTLVGLDSEKSKITMCIDDKRTNLAESPEGPAGPGMLMLDVQPGGNSGTIELDLPQVPAPTATRMLIRGELHVNCGDGASAETVKVPLNIIVGVGL
jgi:hypothetical protein